MLALRTKVRVLKTVAPRGTEPISHRMRRSRATLIQPLSNGQCSGVKLLARDGKCSREQPILGRSAESLTERSALYRLRRLLAYGAGQRPISQASLRDLTIATPPTSFARYRYNARA
jgi:hypothetical protein